MPEPLDRRRFLAWFSAVGAAALLAPEVLAQGKDAISRAAIAKAETLAGLTFTDDERKLMEKGVGDHLLNFERLRAVPLDNAVPPALLFRPLLPGRRRRPSAPPRSATFPFPIPPETWPFSPSPISARCSGTGRSPRSTSPASTWGGSSTTTPSSTA